MMGFLCAAISNYLTDKVMTREAVFFDLAGKVKTGMCI